MLQVYTKIKSSSTYSQAVLMQGVMYIVLVTALIFGFNWQLLFVGLFLGWLLFLVGGSIGLHRWLCHRTFTPKNKFVKWLLLWAGVQCTVGSAPGFVGSHRLHHKHSDTEQDPFLLKDSWWYNFKIWFYHYPDMTISPKLLVDIMRDDDVKASHNHYWKLWSIYPALVLILGGPIYFAYLVALPIVYIVFGMAWVTVMAHSPTWRKWFNGKTNLPDQSWDSNLFAIPFVGEGYHYSHHIDPSASDYTGPGRFDLSGYLIKFLKS